MAELSSLMNVAPVMGAGMIGAQAGQEEVRRSLEQKQLQELIQELQIKNQHSQTMNPLLQQHQGLQNQGLEAGLPGITADSITKQMAAKKAQALSESDIAAGLAGNQTKRVDETAKGNEAFGRVFSQLSFDIENTPAPLRQARLREQLQQMNLGDGPVAQAMLQSFSGVPADKLPAALKMFGDKMLQSNPDYRKSLDQKEAQLQGIREQNATQIKLEQMRIDAGKYKRAGFMKTVDERLRTAKTAAEKAEVLETAYYEAVLAKDEDMASHYKVRALDARKRAAEDHSNRGLAKPGSDMEATTGGRVPNTPPPAANAPIADNSNPLVPAGQAQAVPPGAVAKLKANPKLAAAFDQKYGAGAAKRVLGQ